MAYRTLNPFTEQTVQEVAEHTDHEVETALAKADALYRSSWSKGDMAPAMLVSPRNSRRRQINGLMPLRTARSCRTSCPEDAPVSIPEAYFAAPMLLVELIMLLASHSQNLTSRMISDRGLSSA